MISSFKDFFRKKKNIELSYQLCYFSNKVEQRPRRPGLDASETDQLYGVAAAQLDWLRSSLDFKSSSSKPLQTGV